MNISGVIFAALVAFACQSGKMVNASSRPVEGFDKQKGSLVPVQTRDIGNGAAPQLYVKNRKVDIRAKGDNDGTGSLYKKEDGRNGLFTTDEPIVPGSYVTVEVSSNYLDTKAKEKSKKGANLDKSEDSALEAAMLKGLPDLEPADKEIPIVKRFRMKVTHRFDDGDLGVFMKRESSNANETQLLQIKARIPYMRLVSGDNLKTSDLVDVEFHEVSHGESVDRTSSGWEDEYSLRMSGFDESKSKVAADLDDKRRKLAETAEQMKTSLHAMSDERKQFSKQREGLLEGKKKAEEELVATKKQFDEQSKELEKFKPKEEEGKDKKEDPSKPVPKEQKKG